MKIDHKTFMAIGNLGYRFWAHIFRRMFNKPAPGEEYKKFMDNYSADNLVPLTHEEREKLYDYQKCINCSACSSVCPVYKPAVHGTYRAPESISISLSRSFPDFPSARDSVQNCTQCGACSLACSRGIDIPDLVMTVRRKALETGDATLMASVSPALNNIHVTGNIYGVKPDEQFDKYKKQSARYVFFIGCTARNKTPESTSKILSLLKRLGVDFTVIDDKCCGGYHATTGFDVSVIPQARENIEAIRATGAEAVITSCPHGYNTMKNLAPYKGAIKVMHVTELLASIDFKVIQEDRRIAYHDPCFLGRRNGIFDAPRQLITRLGISPLELAAHHFDSICCGSRDGTFIPDAAVSTAMAEQRMRQAVEAGADVLLTECPACITAFREVGSKVQVESITAYLSDRYET